MDQQAQATTNRVLVEGDPENQLVLIYSLGRKGYFYGVAKDGRQAVEMLWRNPDFYSVVLMDSRMPSWTGSRRPVLFASWKKVERHTCHDHSCYGFGQFKKQEQMFEDECGCVYRQTFFT
jgi:response regulator RpfG family c-di-GMP phosphodiesterase